MRPVPEIPSTDVTSLLHRQPTARSALAGLAALHHSPPIGRSTFASGLEPLDEVLDGGVHPGEFALIVGKPAVGKTILALQWAQHIARSGGVAVYACYEHDEPTLIARLLASELGAMVETGDELVSRAPTDALVECVRRIGSGRADLSDARREHPAISEAHRRVARYADRLVVAASCRLDVDGLDEIAAKFSDGPAALFVDYVQKVPVGASMPGADRSSVIAEELKALSLGHDIAVVGIAGVGDDGLAARRIHGHNVRGASALTYEADVIVVLNDKLDIVSRAHLTNSPTRADEFRRQVVVSVEKNRRGVGSADLEFAKDFAYSRFGSSGRWVAERLWAEGSLEQ